MTSALNQTASTQNAWISYGAVQGPVFKQAVRLLTSTPQSILPNVSGGVVSIPLLAANSIINLPAVASSAGVSFKLVAEVKETKTVTISSPAADVNISGYFNTAAGVVTAVNGTGVTSVIMAANSMLAGDQFEIYSNGTNWFVQGFVTGAVNTGITTA